MDKNRTPIFTDKIGQASKLPPHIIDTHSHSNFSPDSSMSLQEMVAAASLQGLAGIAITDHLDLKTPDGDTRFTFDIAQQQQQIDTFRSNYNLISQFDNDSRPQIDNASWLQNGNNLKSRNDNYSKPQNGNNNFKIFKGIEVGLQSHNLEETKEFLKGYDFDTVIASIHFVDGVDPYYGGYYEGLTEKKSYRRYLDLTYELIVAYPNFDVLGHYDYIARYAPYANCTVFYKEYSDIFDSIFKYLIHNGKALEINTNTYRTRNGKTPALDANVLKRYLELGGELLAIGSDAHTPERFGENFSHYLKMAHDCGFNYITHYNQRKPIPQKYQ